MTSGFKSDAIPAHSRDYERSTRSENHDPFGDRFCGRSHPRTSNRSRGFSVRHHKSAAIKSGSAVIRTGRFGGRRCTTHKDVNATHGGTDVE